MAVTSEQQTYMSSHPLSLRGHERLPSSPPSFGKQFSSPFEEPEQPDKRLSSPPTLGETPQRLSVPSNFEEPARQISLSFGPPAQSLPGEPAQLLSFPSKFEEPAPRPPPLPFGQPAQRLSPPLSFGQPAQLLSGEAAPRPSPPLSFGQPAQRLPGEAAPRPSPLSFGEPVQPLSVPKNFEELAPRPSPLSSGQPPQCLPGEPAQRLSVSKGFGEPALQPSPLPFGQPAQRLSVPPTFGENQRLEIFSGDASWSTMTKSISEVRHAPPLTAQRRMIFHHVRLSAALKAFQKDKCQTSRQKWWMQNLEFELVWTQPLTDQCIFTMHTGRITR